MQTSLSVLQRHSSAACISVNAHKPGRGSCSQFSQLRHVSLTDVL